MFTKLLLRHKQRLKLRHRTFSIIFEFTTIFLYQNFSFVNTFFFSSSKKKCSQKENFDIKNGREIKNYTKSSINFYFFYQQKKTLLMTKTYKYI